MERQDQHFAKKIAFSRGMNLPVYSSAAAKGMKISLYLDGVIKAGLHLIEMLRIFSTKLFFTRHKNAAWLAASQRNYTF